MRKRGWVLLASTIGLAVSLGLASHGAAEAASTREALQEAAPAERAGTETCAACHEDTVKAFMNTPHSKSEQGCEGCHGGGKAHAQPGAAAQPLAQHERGKHRHDHDGEPGDESGFGRRGQP